VPEQKAIAGAVPLKADRHRTTHKILRLADFDIELHIRKFILGWRLQTWIRSWNVRTSPVYLYLPRPT
jgi:hypothetical protein